MWLEEICLDKLQDRSSPLRWAKGGPSDRRLLYDQVRGLVFKIWPSSYDHCRSYWKGNELVQSSTTSGLFGFDIGFFDEQTCPAFVDLICDDAGTCRGYVARVGSPIAGRADPRLLEFVECVKLATLRTGYAHTDFCHNNLVAIDERISFIDFDSVFTELRHASIPFEESRGSLRPHVYQEYRDFVRKMVPQSSTSSFSTLMDEQKSETAL